jgi:hypothetical protein
MKGIIKVRSFDSLKKLSTKRAKGKLRNISELNDLASKSIITLEKLKLLTPELLWEITERKKHLYIEGGKLRYVIECRKKSITMTEGDLIQHLGRLANIKLAILRVPYEIRIIPEYYYYINKREKNEDNISG